MDIDLIELQMLEQLLQAQRPCDCMTTIEFFVVSTKVTDLTFLPMLQIFTFMYIYSYHKMLTFAKKLYTY